MTVTPPGKSCEQAAAAVTASAVLPTPPGPSRVVTGAEVTLSMTSLISRSLPTSRRGRNTVGLRFGAFARAFSEMLTRHYRLHDDALAMTSGVRARTKPFVASRSFRRDGSRRSLASPSRRSSPWRPWRAEERCRPFSAATAPRRRHRRAPDGQRRATWTSCGTWRPPRIAASAIQKVASLLPVLQQGAREGQPPHSCRSSHRPRRHAGRTWRASSRR